MADTQSAHGSSPSANVFITSCRTCSGRFECTAMDGKHITIITGISSTDEAYIAISYVWGDAHPLTIPCLNTSCNSLLQAPGSKIWLDALSVDQKDHSDIARQVAVMGDIYSNAQCVTVLLPDSDRVAFELLEAMTNVGRMLLERRGYFNQHLAPIIRIESTKWNESIQEEERRAPRAPTSKDAVVVIRVQGSGINDEMMSHRKTSSGKSLPLTPREKQVSVAYFVKLP